jgi:hypothetical protein
MPSVLYVRDPRFKAHGASVKVNDGKTQWVTGAKLPYLFDKIDWSKVIMLGHNLPFDAHILSYHYGKYPALYIDTLGMARAVIGGAIPRRSLDAVGEHFGLGGKLGGGAALNAVAGVRDLTPEQEANLASYAVQDADLTYGIFKKMAPHFPRAEYAVLDWTIRMITQPKLGLDASVLDECHSAEVERKRAMLESLGIDQTTINSNKQFAGLLQSLGVEPPLKPSKTAKDADGKPKITFAFSKQDMDFVELAQHHDKVVSDLVSLRLATKSTIEETRAGMLAQVARTGDGRLPAVLLYSGAQNTHRLSGGDRQNLQNLGRKSPIKKGIIAERGYKLINADLAQIELRNSLKLAGESLTLRILATGDCVYSDFARDLFNCEVTKALAETDEEVNRKRQVGKVSILQLGYQSSWRTFQKALWVQTGMKLSDAECERIVDRYRSKYVLIRQLWRDLGQAIAGQAHYGNWATKPAMEKWPLKFEPGRIVGPSGLALKYPELHQRFNAAKGEKEFVYRNWSAAHDGHGWVSLYGGKLTENICQFLTREVLTEHTKALIGRGLPAALQVHDALLFVVPDAQVENATAQIKEVMSTSPAWWPGLPLAVDVKVGQNYGEMK